MKCAARFALAATVGFVPALADSPAPVPAADDPLIGIWSFETTFGPAVKGELTVARQGSTWRATLSRASTTFQAPAHTVRFAFPGQLGRFRGALTDEGRTIDGFWIRPGVTADPRDPGGSGQAFATPLVLKRAGRDLWRGTRRPLRDFFVLYLRIFRNDEGALLGAFRNPDQHSHGGAMQFRVSRAGDDVRFSAQPDPAEPEIRLDAKLVNGDALKLFWPDLDRLIELRRRTPSQAAAFFPRPPGEPAYRYRQPPATDDGWSTARAGEVGIDEDALTRLIQERINADPAARRPSLIHSILVAYRGKLVLEEYFFGFQRETPHDVRSAGKTFASVLLGAAMRQGLPIAPETKVYDLLVGMGPFANPDPRKSQVTLAHLMTHTAGLACNDNDDASPGNEGTMQRQRQQPNWWKYTLDLPMAHEPGTRYAYGSANMNLMGAALTTATRTWLPELFERTVARPLQFGLYHWNLMPNDEGYLGGGAWLRPRDLLKVGQTYLDGGVWHGRRVVDASWVKRSTAPHFHISPASTGIEPEQFGEFYGEGDDGYAWHLGRVRSPNRDYASYAATGNGGQVLLVVPELELAVVFTGGNYGQGGIWGRWGDEIVGREIVPAIRR
jgi:CubicO group peptidase (beta-lactamase class C family)